MKSEDKSAAKRTVAVARFSAMGDIAMTVPAVYAACAANPDVRFVMVTRKAFAPIYAQRPDNLEVLGIDLREDRYKGAVGMCRLAADLRRKGVTDFADLHNVLRTKILSLCLRLHGVRVRCLDKQRRLRRRLCADGALAAQPLGRVIDRYADVFAALRLECRPDDFAGYSSEAVAEDCPSTAVTRIGIAPFAAHRGKVYPAERMFAVVETLARRPGTRIYLFGGGKTEAPVLAQWTAQLCGRGLDVVDMAAAKAGFAGEIDVISRLDAMVSMDSGNMHLAALCRVPVVSIWGATHPAAGFTPWKGEASLMLGDDTLACRPCSIFGNRECRFGDYRCFDAVTPQAVVSAVDRAVNIKRTRQ